MATDYRKVVENMLSFYDFQGRTVVAVGAGGGQLIEYGRSARQILALDNDPQALEKLKENLKIAGLEDRFTPLLADFYRADAKGDVVLFEFCLHEMPEPKAAIQRALTMAPEIVVVDHWPGSEWSYYTAEEEKIRESWAAIVSFPVKKMQSHDTFQFFKDYAELYQKLKGQGEISLARIGKFKSRAPISIPASYGLALI